MMTRILQLTALIVVSFLSTARGQTSPQPIHLVSPHYPDLARQAQIQGVVNVRVHVTAEGTVASTEVLKGRVLFREEVERNVAKWKFVPGVESTLEIMYEFRLDPPRVSYHPEPEVIFDLPTTVLVISHAPVPIEDVEPVGRKKKK